VQVKKLLYLQKQEKTRPKQIGAKEALSKMQNSHGSQRRKNEEIETEKSWAISYLFLDFEG